MATGLGIALHTAGLPVGPDRCERLARAVTVMGATSVAELRACALATMVSDPGQMSTFDRVFAALFGGPSPIRDMLPPVQPAFPRAEQDGGPPPGTSPKGSQGDPGGWSAGMQVSASGSAPDDGDEPLAEAPALRHVASAAERLRGRDFTELTPAELRQLVTLMREMSLAVPPRRTRRYRRPATASARICAGRCGWPGAAAARRSGWRAAPGGSGRAAWWCCATSPARWSRTPARCCCCLYAINGGQMRGGSSGQNRPEVFSFATRLTRLTPALAASSPDKMLAKAGEAAPDWSGGTRIGAAVKEFNDHYGSRGMARGAVILIISDGWETGEPELLGAQMARLSRVAHRIVWANPRTQSPRYRPEVGGMAAAWPYCDAVVSAHNLDALDDLLDALRSR